MPTGCMPPIFDLEHAVVMEIENKDYGRTGGVKDPFGNTWWIVAEPKNK